MTIYFDEEGAVKLPLSCEETAEFAARTALDVLMCPYEAQINLLLTTNEEIRRMNKEFRQTDRETDVLSFPMIDFPSPGDFSRLEEMEDCFDPETGELMLGDIVISKDKVLEQAKDYGHSILREFSFLIVHSVLHLTGYDHMKEDERACMEDLQRMIMEKAGIPR